MAPSRAWKFGRNPKKVSFPSSTSKVIKRNVLGGLHHVYFHSEAAYCSNHLTIAIFLPKH
ncbi:hypothetical protein BV917_06515 [Leptospira santarosai serovar Guaricura]|nr:hypothetical protein BV917_06515 [Leptospira santarosai serovar Guaricura]